MSRNLYKQPTILVCTMGSRAQVVTLVLDALLKRTRSDEPISQVCVFHLSLTDARIARALGILRSELRSHYPSPPVLRSEVVRTMGRTPGETGAPIADKSNPEFGDAAYYTACRGLAQIKNDGYRIDLCCTGGPHALGMIVHSAASLICSSEDRLWDLYSSDAFLDETREIDVMHARPGDDVRITPLRFVGFGQLFPHLNEAARMSPAEIVASGNSRIRTINDEACVNVISALTDAQRAVLRTFAAGVTSVKDAAERMHLSKYTIDSHKRPIYDACRAYFGLPEDRVMHWSFFREHFGNLPERIWRDTPRAR